MGAWLGLLGGQPQDSVSTTAARWRELNEARVWTMILERRDPIPSLPDPQERVLHDLLRFLPIPSD